MKLFTADIDKKLFAQYLKGSDLANQVVVAKIFNPYGRGTWYLLNSDPEDPEYLWAIVDMDDIEVGSVNRSDLENIRIKPFMLGLERDLSFTPINAAEIYRGLNSGKTYATGGGVGEYKLNDNVDFYYGRADEKKVISGTISDILNDGYTISTGFTQVMVKPNEIVGYSKQAEPKKKRFGIFADGGGFVDTPEMQKARFAKDNFNPKDAPLIYKVYDENGKVVGKTKRINKLTSFEYDLGLNYTPKWVAFDNSGNERILQVGVNSKGEQFAGGGGVDSENKEMVLNNNKQIAHHTEELSEAVKKSKYVPAWVVAKVNRSASDLSDATHYMEGQDENYAEGGAIYKHKHMNATAKILEKTNKGYKVEFTDNSMKKPKTKIMYFLDINFDKDKGYFEKMQTGGGVQSFKKGNKVKTREGKIETIVRKNKNGNYETQESDYTWNPSDLTLVSKMKTGGAMTKKEFISEKVGKVMHEFKKGDLHSGKSGKIVKNPKQAIAIGLSEGKRGWKHKK